MILRHLLLQRSLIFIQGCLQHPKVSVSHNPSKILFGHEQCCGGPAQHHLAVSPAADLSCPQADSAVRALDHVGRDQATRKARRQPQTIHGEHLRQAFAPSITNKYFRSNFTPRRTMSSSSPFATTWFSLAPSANPRTCFFPSPSTPIATST